MTDGEKLVRDLNDLVTQVENARETLDEAEVDRDIAESLLAKFLESVGGSFGLNGVTYWLDGDGAVRRRYPSGLVEGLIDYGWHRMAQPTSEDPS